MKSTSPALEVPLATRLARKAALRDGEDAVNGEGVRHGIVRSTALVTVPTRHL